MTQVVIEFDPGALSALRKGPKEFAYVLAFVATVSRLTASSARSRQPWAAVRRGVTPIRLNSSR